MAKEAKYREMFNKKKMPEGYLEAPLAYDAVWAVALGKLQSREQSWILFFFISALNSSAAYLESINQSLDSYNYDNKAVADIIMDNVQKVKFEGISVRLAHNLPSNCSPDVRNTVCRAPWPSARTLGTGWR